MKPNDLISSSITQANIRSAVIEYAIHEIEHPYKDSTDYDVIIDDRPYPPIAIMGIASSLADRSDECPRLKGGVGTPCFKKFEELGFQIVRKGSHIVRVRELNGSLSWAEYLEKQRELRDYDPRLLLSKCLELKPHRSINLFCGRREPNTREGQGSKKDNFTVGGRDGFSTIQVIFGPERIGLYLKVNNPDVEAIREITNNLDRKFKEPLDWNSAKPSLGKEFTAYMIRIETAGQSKSVVNWLAEKNQSSKRSLGFAKERKSGVPINWQPIKHVINSDFLDDIKQQLLIFKENINAGHEAEIKLSTGGGYEFAKHLLQIKRSDNEYFYTTWSGLDKTRFPARVKALAVALKECEIRGIFKICYKDGLFSLKILKDEARLLENHPVNLQQDLLNDLRGESSDVVREVKTRLEQAKLRKILLDGKNVQNCQLCGNPFATEFLVAAHIKPRRLCSEKERLDSNIAILLCKFGCDELFEKGYLVVGSTGQIIQNKETSNNIPNSLIKSLSANLCVGWDKQTNGKYFEEHRKFHFTRTED